MNQRLIDIKKTPFSRYGAYLSVTADEKNNYLTIHNVRRRFGEDRAYKLRFFYKGKNEEWAAAAVPECIYVSSRNGEARIYIRDDQTLVVDSKNLDVEFVQISADGYGCAESEYEFKMISVYQRIYTYFFVKSGRGSVRDMEHEENEFSNSTRYRNQKLTITCEEGRVTAALRMSIWEPLNISFPLNPEQEIRTVREEWEKFKNTLADLKEDSFEELTWYNIWSSFVRAEDVYHYDVMLMSKKNMSSVWSWDHCFNALVMAKISKRIALEQFIAPFELQGKTGVLPDLWNPNYELVWGITKPPIHGWCFSKLMDQYQFSGEVLGQVYSYLEKWTEYWINYRDSDHDGIPEYPQGCDCGWDNATVFDDGYFKETPDLPAFLILQMKTLCRIAAEMEKKEPGKWKNKAEEWEKKSEVMLANLYEHSWEKGTFISKKSHTHEWEEKSGCLLNLMPLVLGEFLDCDKKEKLIRKLKAEFLTEYGLATESPFSSKYESDGYWRGPVWAPTTYLIVDGLKRCKEEKLAREIAEKFCNMVKYKAHGNYENFDALTGKGLRAPGYTWTASVYMLLHWEYMENGE